MAKRKRMSLVSEDGLSSENIERLNRDFYDAAPWVYFQQRLAHLMLVSDSKRYREVYAEGVQVGDVRLGIEFSDGAGPSTEQRYVAIESEILLHHAAETLLRFLHAHASEDPCPWLRMSRLTAPGELKSWVRGSVLASSQAREVLCARVFAYDPRQPLELGYIAEYVRLAAQHFLDADPYNAAKHGMAIDGAAERWTVRVGDLELLDRDGASLRWLAAWAPRREEPRRWTSVSRVFSVPATVALIFVTTVLLRSLWLRARHERLSDPLDEVFRPQPPSLLFEANGVRHHVVADWFSPLRYEGVEPRMYVRSRHFEAPAEGFEPSRFGADTGAENGGMQHG